MTALSLGCFLLTAFNIITLGNPFVALVSLVGLACGIVAIIQSPRSAAAWVATVLNGFASSFVILSLME